MPDEKTYTLTEGQLQELLTQAASAGARETASRFASEPTPSTPAPQAAPPAPAAQPAPEPPPQDPRYHPAGSGGSSFMPTKLRFDELVAEHGRAKAPTLFLAEYRRARERQRHARHNADQQRGSAAHQALSAALTRSGATATPGYHDSHAPPPASAPTAPASGSDDTAALWAEMQAKYPNDRPQAALEFRRALAARRRGGR
jgi:hypothetical protein